MSTYWGYYCKICNESSDHCCNHGEEQLTEYFLLKSFEQHNQLSWCSVSCGNADDTAEFLDKHFTHSICLESEYGRQEEINLEEYPIATFIDLLKFRKKFKGN